MSWHKDDYMPFDPEDMEPHFLNFHEGHLNEYRKRNREYNERFWVFTTLKHLFDQYVSSECSSGSGLVKLIEGLFGDGPPRGFKSWTDALGDCPRLFFEVNMPRPIEYREFLVERFQKVTLPPRSFQDSVPVGTRFEGQTKVDAVLYGKPGVALLFEAKVLSDASPTVRYDVTRNQIARSIDVLLETPAKPGDGLSTGEELRRQRDPDRSYFVLLTPAIFKDERRKSRLYAWLMAEYMSPSSTVLAEDLSHRTDKESVKRVTHRIGWLTFEQCHQELKRVDPSSRGASPWLNPPDPTT